jgi:stage II sporulation protein M
MTFAFSAFMLIFSVAMGYGAWAIDPVVAEAAVEQVINGKFATIAQQMANTSWWGQIMIIFTNNIMATLLIIASGALLPFLPFLIGIVPNGFIIGLMAGLYEYEGIWSKSTFFLGLLPHGLFELPAIVLSATVGMIWGGRNWRSFLQGRTFGNLGTHTKASLAFLPLIFALLLVAAMVEVLLTPALL